MDINSATKIVQDAEALKTALEDRAINKVIEQIGERRRKDVLGLDRLEVTKFGHIRAIVALGYAQDPDYEVVDVTSEDLKDITL